MTESELAHQLYDLYSTNRYRLESSRDHNAVYRSLFFELPNHRNITKVFEAANSIFPESSENIIYRSYTFQDGRLELVRKFKIPFPYEFLYKDNEKSKYLTETTEAEFLLALKKYSIKIQLKSEHRNRAHIIIENLMLSLSKAWKNICGNFTKKRKPDPYL